MTWVALIAVLAGAARSFWLNDWASFCLFSCAGICLLFEAMERQSIRSAAERYETAEQARAAGWRDDLSWSENMALADARKRKRFQEASREV